MSRRHEKKTSSPKLSPLEWDFRATQLPDNEVMPCFLYEYAREYVKQTPEIKSLLRRLAELEHPADGRRNTRTLMAALRRAFEALHTPFGSPHIQPDMLKVPWLALSAQTKFDSAEQFSPSRQQSLRQEGIGSELRSIIVGGESLRPEDCAPRKRGGVGIHLAIVATGMDALHVDSYPDYAASRLAAATLLGETANTVEFGFFSVNWDYPREHIENAMLDWLDIQIKRRSGKKPAYSKRGKNKADSPRGWLKALGAKRLLDNGLTVPQASEYTAALAGAKPIPLYTDKSEWSKAKNVIVPQKLRELFVQR